MRQPRALERWLRAYAAAVGTDAGYGEILDASTAGEGDKPAASTTVAYREALENLWLLDELPAWVEGEDYFSGLKRTPKHYLADPALAAFLLGLGTDVLLEPSTVFPEQARRFDAKYGNALGRLFESLVQLSLRVYTSVNMAGLSFVRTRRGDHEIDFVVSKGLRVVATEAKLAPVVYDEDVKHLHWFHAKMGDRLADAVVITTGQLAYRRPDGVAVVPAALLGP